MPKAQKSPCASYDFTLKEGSLASATLCKVLPRLAKKWAFQLEEGESGYRHFQGRVSLHKKARLAVVIKLFNAHACFKGVHLSLTSSGGASTFDYVLKDDTRVEGPWTDKDPKPAYVPRHIRECSTLRPFQQSILDECKLYNERTIDLVYCPEGNKGKSVLCGKARGLGYRVMPPVFDYKDILRMVYCCPTSSAYFVDMPRSIKQDKLASFFAGLETIKDGYAYDDRYKFKEKSFDSPRIFVFTNKLPDPGYLSKDRWSIWTINDAYELVKYYAPAKPASIPIPPAPKDWMGDTKQEDEFIAQYDGDYEAEMEARESMSPSNFLLKCMECTEDRYCNECSSFL